MPYSLEDTYKNLSINDLIEFLSILPHFGIDDIIKFYSMNEPAIEKSTVQWRITRLLTLGIIKRIGRGQYIIGNHQKFVPFPTLIVKNIHHSLMMKLPELNYCIWTTEWLGAYLPELKSQYLTFVEVEKSNHPRVFMELWEKMENVLLNLHPKIPKVYGKNIIIVKKLISGSPLMESEEIRYPHLEKIVVDMNCDWDKIYPYKSPTFYLFFKKLSKSFSINESKLLRYADRRKKKKVFVKYLERIK